MMNLKYETEKFIVKDSDCKGKWRLINNGIMEYGTYIQKATVKSILDDLKSVEDKFLPCSCGCKIWLIRKELKDKYKIKRYNLR